jgi:hypothetical protein
MLEQQDFIWLEKNGLAFRSWGSNSSRDNPEYTAQVVLKQKPPGKDHPEWTVAKGPIEGIAARKAMDLAYEKGAPLTPDQAHTAVQRLAADKDREIEQLRAQLEAMASKAKPADHPKAPAKQ